LELDEQGRFTAIAKLLGCIVADVEKAVARDDSCYRSYSGLKAMTRVDQVVNFYYEYLNVKGSALRCPAAIKKIYNLLWPESVQDQTMKGQGGCQ